MPLVGGETTEVDVEDAEGRVKVELGSVAAAKVDVEDVTGRVKAELGSVAAAGVYAGVYTEGAEGWFKLQLGVAAAGVYAGVYTEERGRLKSLADEADCLVSRIDVPNPLDLERVDGIGRRARGDDDGARISRVYICPYFF